MEPEQDSIGERQIASVRDFLLELQESIVVGMLSLDGRIQLRSDEWLRGEGGGGLSKVLQGGDLFEKAGVNFSDVCGKELPPSATAARPSLVGCGFRAMGVSVVIHPLNPYLPTTHMNVRFFVGIPRSGDESGTWWFGGGFDLTPFYPFFEDAVSWHRAARSACDTFGEELYPRFKKKCDDYFFLPHRDEHRGIGGLFFDDFQGDGFDHAFSFTCSVGKTFFPAYLEIVERRRHLEWGERERQFQLYRRGRYVEFNLLHDRGTLFGIQSGGRTESILMSLPPLVRWDYDWKPEAGSPEELLYKDFLRPRDWLELGC